MTATTKNADEIFKDNLVETIVAYCQQQDIEEPDELIKQHLIPMLAEVTHKSLGKILGKERADDIKVSFGTDPALAPEETPEEHLFAMCSQDLAFEMGQIIHEKMSTYPERAQQMIVVITALAFVMHNILSKDGIEREYKLGAQYLFNDVFNKMLHKDVLITPSKNIVH